MLASDYIFSSRILQFHELLQGIILGIIGEYKELPERKILKA